MSGSQEPHDEERLEVLMLDYEMARADERNMITSQATILGVGIALTALLAGALTQVCTFGMRLPDDCANTPDLVLAVAPLLPLALFAYVQMLGVGATIRSYYLRGLESELRTYSDRPLSALGHIPAASYTGLLMEATSFRRGRPTYRLLALFILLAVILVFGGITVFIGISVDAWQVKAIMVAVYGPAAAIILLEAIAATIRGPSLFLATGERFINRDRNDGLPIITSISATHSSAPTLPRAISDPNPASGGDGERAQERHLLSYLVLPRKEDVIKWVIAPLAYLIAVWSLGDWGRPSQFVLLWLVFEYLIYQARYQWNDVLGVGEDLVHAERRARGRLPMGRDVQELRRNILVSLAIGVVRIGLALVIGYSIGMLRDVAVLILLVFTVAVPYELLRRRAKRVRGTQQQPIILGIWLLVGLGYPIRAGLGLAFAGFHIFSSTMIVAVVYFVAFGIMFVLMTWVLDASSYSRVGQDGRWHVLDTLSEKPHLRALLMRTKVQFADSSGPVSPANFSRKNQLRGSELSYGGEERLLSRRSVPFFTPWNYALIASVVAGVVLGAHLAGLPREATWPLAVVALIALAGSIVVSRVALGATSAASIGLVSVALGMFGFWTEARNPWLVVLPWLVVMVTYVVFRQSSYGDLKKFAKAFDTQLIRKTGIILLSVGRVIGLFALRKVVGEETWQAISAPGPIVVNEPGA